ncbi:MAG: transcription antitermination factor NusB [Pseudomonadota bacterium]
MPSQDKSGKPPNRRTVARLAAVQALYQMDISGADLPRTLSEFETYRLDGDVEGEKLAKADPAFFKMLVSGVVDDQIQLDREVDRVLAQGWPLKRIDATLRAILRAGAFELMFRPEIPFKAAINEYVEIAHAFFDDDLSRMVNGVLDTIAQAAGRSDTPPERAEA